MSDTLKLEYKVGAIEFKAEGPADVVEQQRVNFMNAVLPAAVDAMVRTQAVPVQANFVEAVPQTPMLEAGVKSKPETVAPSPEIDLSRTNLSAFLKQYGTLTELDFTLFAAYFDEVKNGVKAFFIDDVKRYYAEARRALPKNLSVSIHRLAEKGFIMDTLPPEGAKAGKYYMLTDAGMAYIKEYKPKDSNGEKKTHTKTRKVLNKAPSACASLNADDLNLGNYPAVKTLSGAKEQVIMAMYIVTNENKGEWFTVDDVIHLLINVFEVPANTDKVNGVFKRNKSMFTSQKDAENKKAYRHKLLSGAKDFAKELVEKHKGPM